MRKDSADGAAVLGFQCGVCCCSMYWRTMEIRAAAIALFYAFGTLIGGVGGPALFWAM